jgi:signal transduction histidine kinase
MLAARFAAASLLAIVLLFGFFFVKYTIDVRELRLATLKADLLSVQQIVLAGGDPSVLPQFRRQPPAYAFRVFDRRSADARKVFSQANPELFEIEQKAIEAETGNAAPALNERFGQFQVPGTNDSQQLWTLTDRVVEGGRSLWVQVAMIDDPDRRWLGVIRTELIDHVGVPVLVLVPALALAMFLATRNAIRPLESIAEQAAGLGEAVRAGRRLVPLADGGLPEEFGKVVTALNTMLGKLELSVDRQRQFTANAAHELRTPLSVLLLEASQFSNGPTKDRIIGEVESLRRTVNQLLRFAQADDAMEQERRTIDVTPVARRVCEELAGQALERGQDIAFDSPDEAVLAWGNSDLLDVAIRNLVENALRHSPSHETISVAVTSTGTLSLGPRVTVEDRGSGVSDDHKPLIFERFWRSDRTRIDGAGIGLALARQIAQLHGGDVTVHDRDGGGARFLISLPPYADSSRPS